MEKPDTEPGFISRMPQAICDQIPGADSRVIAALMAHALSECSDSSCILSMTVDMLLRQFYRIDMNDIRAASEGVPVPSTIDMLEALASGDVDKIADMLHTGAGEVEKKLGDLIRTRYEATLN